jgi:hypothetical protein
VGSYVFAYGSLVDGGEPLAVPGYRRRWQVAMDNSVDIPGYKYFVDATTGERPRVMVAFLDLAEDPRSEAVVNGVLVPFTPALDERERNYGRREIAPGIHAYVGTSDARERFARGPTVIAREYYDRVRAGFEALGQLGQFETSTDAPPVPVVDLKRVDLPPRTGG